MSLKSHGDIKTFFRKGLKEIFIAPPYKALVGDEPERRKLNPGRRDTLKEEQGTKKMDHENISKL